MNRILGKRLKTGCSRVREGCDGGNCLRMKERWEGGRKRGGSIGQQDQMEMWKQELKGLWACAMNDGKRLRGGGCRWREKGWRKKDAGDLSERKRRGLWDESEEWTTDGKLEEKGMVSKTEEPGLPQDWANPSNPDTSQTRRLNHPIAAATGRSSTPAYCGLTGWVSVTGAPLRVGMVGLAAARPPRWLPAWPTWCRFFSISACDCMNVGI